MLEQCESRIYPTMVFIFNGNGLAEARPNSLTQFAAQEIWRHGDRPIQLSTPALSNPRVFYQFARHLHTISHGKPIGLLGYSAGGTLAMRLAGQPGAQCDFCYELLRPARPESLDQLSSR